MTAAGDDQHFHCFSLTTVETAQMDDIFGPHTSQLDVVPKCIRFMSHSAVCNKLCQPGFRPELLLGTWRGLTCGGRRGVEAVQALASVAAPLLLHKLQGVSRGDLWGRRKPLNFVTVMMKIFQ